MTQEKLILKIEGEPEGAWQLEIAGVAGLNVTKGEIPTITSATIKRGDGKFHECAYLPPKSEHNPANYGQAGVIEHGKDGEVGRVVPMLAKDEYGKVWVSYVEGVRMGNNGVKPMLESQRASIDNIKGTYAELVTDAESNIGRVYSNNARITGDQADGAPIGVGVILLKEKANDFKWKGLKEAVEEIEESMSLASILKALGYLGMLDGLSPKSE